MVLKDIETIRNRLAIVLKGKKNHKLKKQGTRAIYLIESTT
jgi:hypothetical protein